jgi:hypothetical protein
MNDSMNKFLLSTLLAIRESGNSLDSEEKKVSILLANNYP